MRVSRRGRQAVLVGWLVCGWAPQARAASTAEPRLDPSPILVKGVRLIGEPADIAAFTGMIAEAMRDSPTLRKILADIDAVAEPEESFDIVLGRHQKGVVIDSFERGFVDVEDLERLPSAHAEGLAQDEITREEQIVHVLAERRHAAKLAARFRRLGKPEPDRAFLFASSHEIGQASQNGYRAERGQVPVTDAISMQLEGRVGEVFVKFTLADGRASWVKTRDFGRIWQITPPGRDQG